MKTVTSKIKLNIPKITQMSNATATALEKTVDGLYTEVVNAQVMPFDQGDLQGNTYPEYKDSRKGVVKLITPGAYPRRLYYHPEYNFQTKENAHAQGNWYEPWISGKHKNFCKNAFAQFYKKEAGLQ